MRRGKKIEIERDLRREKERGIEKREKTKRLRGEGRVEMGFQGRVDERVACRGGLMLLSVIIAHFQTDNIVAHNPYYSSGFREINSNATYVM